MNNFNKYLTLLFLIVGAFLGFILLQVILFYFMKLFSVIVFNIPGFNGIFHYFITAFPYLIFFAAHYYLFTKVGQSQNRISRSIARILLLLGVTSCAVFLIVATLNFWKIRYPLLTTLGETSQYILFVQLVIVFLCAAILASGDPKEKDWMERREERMKQ